MEEIQKTLKETLSSNSVDGEKLKEMIESLKTNVKQYHAQRITEFKPSVSGGGYRSRKNNKKSKKTSRKNK